MPSIIVSNEERTVLSGTSAATAAAIRDAMTRAAGQLRSMPLPEDIPSRDVLGGWVGPAPRVTRFHAISMTAGPNVTHVAWLYSWPDGQSEKTNRYITQTLTSLVTSNLREISNARFPHDGNFGISSVATYNPSVNGPVSWWQNGDAANTLTRLVFPPFSMTSGRDEIAREQPDGPGTVTLTTPQGPSIDDWKTILKYAAIIVGVGGVIYLVGPFIRSVAAAGAETVGVASDSVAERRRRHRRLATR